MLVLTFILLETLLQESRSAAIILPEVGEL
jgi:hypothetical protein